MTVKFMSLMTASILLLTACQHTSQTVANVKTKANATATANTTTKIQAPTEILIIYYQQGKKQPALSAIERLGGKIVYDYQTMNGFAAAFNGLSIAQTRSQLEQTDGILVVLNNEINQLH